MRSFLGEERVFLKFGTSMTSMYVGTAGFTTRANSVGVRRPGTLDMSVRRLREFSTTFVVGWDLQRWHHFSSDRRSIDVISSLARAIDRRSNQSTIDQSIHRLAGFSTIDQIVRHGSLLTSNQSL